VKNEKLVLSMLKPGEPKMK